MAGEQHAALSLTTREKLPLEKMMRTLSDKSAECKVAELNKIVHGKALLVLYMPLRLYKELLLRR